MNVFFNFAGEPESTHMNILLINAHNRENSFCSALAVSYIEGASSSGHQVQVLNLRDLELEKYLRYGHDKRYEPEGDVLNQTLVFQIKFRGKSLAFAKCQTVIGHIQIDRIFSTKEYLYAHTYTHNNNTCHNECKSTNAAVNCR